MISDYNPYIIQQNIMPETFEDSFAILEYDLHGLPMTNKLIKDIREEVLNLLRFYKMDENNIKSLKINGKYIDRYLYLYIM